MLAKGQFQEEGVVFEALADTSETATVSPVVE
jgi:hypothetical protein